jgi:hypothetical protein
MTDNVVGHPRRAMATARQLGWASAAQRARLSVWAVRWFTTSSIHMDVIGTDWPLGGPKR